MKHLHQPSYLFVVASLLLALVLAACGSGASSGTAIPTNTQIPTYNFVQPTATLPRETAAPTDAAESTAESPNEAASTSEAAATSETVATSEATTVASASTPAAAMTLDPEVVTRGKGRYDALKCAECHGANGEGTDKGSSLIVSAQSEDEFTTFMRSGGKLGSDHQYATNRLSQTGGEALYQYLLSLRKSS